MRIWDIAWTRTTLLARELRLTQEAQDEEGEQRAFVINADQIN